MAPPIISKPLTADLTRRDIWNLLDLYKIDLKHKIFSLSKRCLLLSKSLLLLLLFCQWSFLILGCSSFEFLSIYVVAKPLFRIWPLGFVFHLNVTFFNYLCRDSDTMIIRVKVMPWNDKQKLHFISFQNTWVNIFYLSSTYLGPSS